MATLAPAGGTSLMPPLSRQGSDLSDVSAISAVSEKDDPFEVAPVRSDASVMSRSHNTAGGCDCGRGKRESGQRTHPNTV